MGAIKIRDLTFTYEGVDTGPALESIDLDVAQGEFLSVVGANGSGKTTLCSAIRGFVPQFYKGDISGSVEINGRNIKDVSIGDLAREVGFVFQNPFTQMSGISATVYDELAFGLGNLGIEPEETRRRVDEMIETANLTELADRNPYELSGGQQQRVALAAILVMQQDILVIDEPTSQLDPQSTDDVFELILQMKELGKTIVLVEHKMDHVAAFSDRVALMNEGRIELIDTPRNLFANPRTAELGTRLPEPLLVAQRLKQEGVPVKDSPLTSDELFSSIEALRKDPSWRSSK
ncbi:MAG: ABC transporter ATP-binding protein [Actinomycetaceae bacterium]|nr:ABC transporter ATP-binding protein [Actinomycetaceae bacterium]